MIDIVKRRYLYFGISLLVIIPGLIALLVWGFPLAITDTLARAWILIAHTKKMNRIFMKRRKGHRAP